MTDAQAVIITVLIVKPVKKKSLSTAKFREYTLLNVFVRYSLISMMEEKML